MKNWQFLVIVAVIVILLVIGFKEFTKGDEERVLKLQKKAGVQNSFSETYGIKKLTELNKKPSVYLDHFQIKLTQFVQNIYGTSEKASKLAFIDWANLVKQDDKQRAQIIAQIYQIPDRITFSLIAKAFNTAYGKNLQKYLITVLSADELIDVYKFVNSLPIEKKK